MADTNGNGDYSVADHVEEEATAVTEGDDDILLPSCSQQATAMEGCEAQPAAVQWQPPEKVTISVEVCLRKTSTAKPEEIAQSVERMLGKRSLTYVDGLVPLIPGEDKFLDDNVDSIAFVDTEEDVKNARVLLFWQVTLQVYVYQLNEEGPAEEIEEDEEVATFHEWALPARDFHGLWESLIFEMGVKNRLLRYATSALLFADRRVNPQLVSWNRVVLLFGPPGTGKTSLCKALSQKLAVRFQQRYRQAQLVEVNAHSLFSKWFSESGKLVAKLFQNIHRLLDDLDSLVFVLIDEVETLAAARQAALQGTEPSDSIRVVNALLTQLDSLKQRPNVVILTTSNITQAIDIAFVDRADIKAYIGPPSLQARYEILRSCILELQRAEIIVTLPKEKNLIPVSYLRLEQFNTAPVFPEEGETEDVLALSRELLTTAEACEGLSGRALRKLPFLAHAAQIGSPTCSVKDFISALHKAVQAEHDDRANMVANERGA